MHVLVNCFNMPVEQEGAAGAGKYLQAVLPKLAAGADVCLILSRHNRAAYTTHRAASLVVDRLEDPKVWQALGKADVYYDPQNGLTPRILPSRLPVVVMIHDLQHAHYPHLFSNGRFEERNKDYGFAIARADGVVAISEWEKENLRKYFNKHEVRVVSHSSYLYDWYVTSESKLPKLNYWLGPGSGDYFLYPAVAWPHKNHYRLIEAFKLVNEWLPEERQLHLVLMGTVDHVEATPTWREKLEELGDPSYIHLMGYVPDSLLAAYMQQAKGLVFPSLYEGFGIPLADAMNFEVPILTTELTAIPEVTGGMVTYFRNPLDSYTMAEDLALFNERVDLGNVPTTEAKAFAQRYSTQSTTQGLLDFFEETIELKKSIGRKWSIPSQKRTTESVNQRRVTLIVDLENTLDRYGVQHPLILELLPWLKSVDGQSPFELVLLCPYRHAQHLAGSDAQISAQSFHTMYYDDTFPRSRITALKSLLESVLTTDYFMYHTSVSITRSDFNFVKNAVCYLDHYDDVFSCYPARPGLERLTIRRPEVIEEIQIINLESARNNTLARFVGRVVRTSVCRLDGMIGTIESVSRDVTQYSSITI